MDLQFAQRHNTALCSLVALAPCLIDYIYETSQTTVSAMPSDHVKILKEELQASHEVMRDMMDVKKGQKPTTTENKRT